MRRRVAEAFSDTPEQAAALLDAPVHLIITSDEARYHRRYNEADKLAATGGTEITWPVPFWFIDAGAAMMLALLAAVNEGLSAGFYGHPDQVARLRKVLELPPEAIPIGLIAVGYSAEDSLSSETRQRIKERRRPTSESVHRNRW
jgi:nitroreductase